MNPSNAFSTAAWRAAPWRRSGFGRVLREAAALAVHWLQRARSRRALLMLNDRELRDIGLTRDEAQREGVLPFWR
jgi:uncharacterized protein YjiS (DUF1127 family)